LFAEIERARPTVTESDRTGPRETHSKSVAQHATTIFFSHFVGDACTIAVIPDRID
jgi:hypothetical protein